MLGLKMYALRKHYKDNCPNPAAGKKNHNDIFISLLGYSFFVPFSCGCFVFYLNLPERAFASNEEHLGYSDSQLFIGCKSLSLLMHVGSDNYVFHSEV